MKHWSPDLGAAWRELRLSRAEREAMRLDRFDERWYLAHYPDVAESVRKGQFASGRAHYIRYGYAESRKGCDPAILARSAAPRLAPTSLAALSAWFVMSQWDTVRAWAARMRSGQRAPSAAIFDALRLAAEQQPSDGAPERLSQAAESQLAPFVRSIVKTPSGTAWIGDAWASKTSGAVVIHGHLPNAEALASGDCVGVACYGRDLVPFTLRSGDLVQSDDAGRTGGFTGHVEPAHPAQCSRVFVLAKDTDGTLLVVARRPLAVHDADLFKVMLRQTVLTLRQASEAERLSSEIEKLSTLFGNMFPFALDPPSEQQVAPPASHPRTCHLFLDIGSTQLELRWALGEIIGDRFSRVAITCIGAAPGMALERIQRAVEADHLDVEILWRVAEYRPDALTFTVDPGPHDLVIFGNPLDIVQIDLSQSAIDRARERIDSGAFKSVGYFPAAGDSGPASANAALSSDVLASDGGFVAVLPAAHFRFSDPSSGPHLFHPASAAKALLLALARTDKGELVPCGNADFFPTPVDWPSRYGLEANVLARIDARRILCGARPARSPTSRAQSR